LQLASSGGGEGSPVYEWERRESWTSQTILEKHVAQKGGAHTSKKEELRKEETLKDLRDSECPERRERHLSSMGGDFEGRRVPYT